jgi:hypothetical protein
MLSRQLRIGSIFIAPGFRQMAPGADAERRFAVFDIGDEVQLNGDFFDGFVFICLGKG